jgi:predicted site-specific integrase-resolvase
LEFICKKAACRIGVHSEGNPNKQDVTQELSEDLLSIITVFVARNSGLRAGRNKDDENLKETKKIKEPAGKCKKIRL